MRTTRLVLIAALTLPGAVLARDIVNSDLIVKGDGCFGAECRDNENLSGQLVLKGDVPTLIFRDTSPVRQPNQSWEFSTRRNGLELGTSPVNGAFFFSPRGFFGAGTTEPDHALHVRSDDTPTIRLEQDQTQFGTNTWDLGGNESVFFIREGGDAGQLSFIVEAGAETGALVVDTTSRVGVGTPNPDTPLHINSNLQTPTIRMSSPGNPGVVKGYTWDVGGDGDDFFVGDVVAATQPFRIRPGAPTNAIYVEGNGQVGVGLQNPRAALHVRRNQPANVPHLVLQNRREGGRTELWFEDRDTATDDDALRLQLRGDDFNITFNGTGGSELQVSKTGDVRIFRGDLLIPNGGVIVGGTTLNVPDYVFADDYELMPLSDVAAFIDEHAHLPHIPSSAVIAAHGLDMTAMQLAMLKSHEEFALHTIAQDKLIAAQAKALSDAFARIDRLESKLAGR